MQKTLLAFDAPLLSLPLDRLVYGPGTSIDLCPFEVGVLPAPAFLTQKRCHLRWEHFGRASSRGSSSLTAVGRYLPTLQRHFLSSPKGTFSPTRTWRIVSRWSKRLRGKARSVREGILNFS